jgi:hypothetical protein
MNGGNYNVNLPRVGENYRLKSFGALLGLGWPGRYLIASQSLLTGQ